LAIQRDIGWTFDVSLTAAPFRIVDAGNWPALRIIRGEQKRN
jgi:hypothetical protein